jgi:hypothetical protein
MPSSLETDIPWEPHIYVQRDAFLTRQLESEMENERLFIFLCSANLINHVDSISAVADSPSAVNSEGDRYK